MNKEELRIELVKKTNAKFLNPISWIWLLSAIAIISSIFIYIWDDNKLATKILCTGVVVLIICSIVYHYLNKIILLIIDEEIERKFPEDLESEDNNF